MSPQRPDLSHRSPSVDLAPHRKFTRHLLTKPMPGSPKPETLVGTSVALDADAPTPDLNPNADLVLQLQSTFPPVPLDGTLSCLQVNSRYRQAQLTGRHVQPVDFSDEASQSVLRLANRPT